MRSPVAALLVCLFVSGLAAASLAAEVAITVKVAPNFLDLSAPVRCVTLHTNVPLAQVQDGSVVVVIEDQYPSFWLKASACGLMVVKIPVPQEDLELLPGEADVSVAGTLTTGDDFYGEAAFVVKN